MTSQDQPSTSAGPSSLPFVLKTTEKGGQSLFSSAPIPRGTLVFVDSPLFTIPQDLRSVEDVQSRVKNLGKNEQRQFFSLSNCRAKDKDFSPLMGIFKTNVLPAGPNESAIFPLASRLNHSCRPNCEHTFHSPTSTIQIRTTFPIPTNTELTISYLSTRLLLPSSARRAHLSQSFNFLCACPACTSSPSSDVKRSEIASLKDRIDALFPSSPLEAYAYSLRLLSLCEEEQLVLEGSFARATLAMLVIMWAGEVEIGERWVGEAWREFVVARGEEGEDARRWGRWRGKLGNHPRRGCLGSVGEGGFGGVKEKREGEGGGE